MIEAILAISGDEEVFVTVIVLVTHAGALSPAALCKACVRGYIGKRAIVVVVKKMAGGMLRFLILRGQQVSVHDENIRPTVVVVIEDSHATSRGLDNVSLGFCPSIGVEHSNACLPGKILKPCRAGMC